MAMGSSDLGPFLGAVSQLVSSSSEQGAPVGWGAQEAEGVVPVLKQHVLLCLAQGRGLDHCFPQRLGFPSR